MSPRAARTFWVTTLAGLGVFDLWLAKNATDGDSLSEVTRELFRTETPAGRATLVGAWALLTAWLIPHLLHRVTATTP